MKAKRFNVTLEVEVDAPDNAATEDIERFLAFEICNAGGMSMSNPCYDEGEYEVITYDIEEQ